MRNTKLFLSSALAIGLLSAPATAGPQWLELSFRQDGMRLQVAELYNMNRTGWGPGRKSVDGWAGSWRWQGRSDKAEPVSPDAYRAFASAVARDY